MLPTSKKSQSCIFCSVELTKENSSLEHIFPNSILCSSIFILDTVCKECNQQIGTQIEQPAVPFLKKIIGALMEEGFPIQFGRRKRRSRYIKLSKGVTFLPYDEKVEPLLTTLWADTETKEKILSLYPRSKRTVGLDRSKISSKEFYTYFPDDKNKGLDEIQLLGNKIIFELCFWLWKKDFLQSKDAEYLKAHILECKVDNTKTLTLKENEPLIYLGPEDATSTEQEQVKFVSAFENPPHITFAVVDLSDENGKWLALLNLFGDLEITCNLFNLSSEIKKELDKTKGIVLLIKTIPPRIFQRFTLTDYVTKKAEAQDQGDISI